MRVSLQSWLPSLGRRVTVVVLWELSFLVSSLGGAAVIAAPVALQSGLHELEVELPVELQQLAGRRKQPPLTRAKVTIGVPEDIEVTNDTPVLVISATSDIGYSSSRRLLRRYADVALASGWIIIAADPSDDLAAEEDDVNVRLALNLAALAALGQQWPTTRDASLAFGGFSGGAKFSGWLAAAFAARGRRVVGVYRAGINEDTILSAAKQFRTLNASFKRTPVFLQVGERDDVATPTAHRDEAARLRRAGFEHVRTVYFPGQHEVNAAPLLEALRWFSETNVDQGADGPRDEAH